MFGIAVILASGFLLVHEVLRYGSRGLGTTALFSLGLFVGLGGAPLGALASSGE